MSAIMFDLVPAPGAGRFPSLRARRTQVPRNRKIVLGSPKGGAGKTSTTLATCDILSRSGARVLLVEITEGQAPLTYGWAYDAAMEGEGIGPHLQRIVTYARQEDTYEDAKQRMQKEARAEAPRALASLRRVSTDPTDPATGFDFLPCGEAVLAEVANNTKMHARNIRRALLDVFFEELARAQGAGGWDYILLDVLPAPESQIVRAAMGVADAYGLVVDMESAQPLPGWGALLGELAAIERDRQTSGLFAGLVLNKYPDRPGKTAKTNLLRIKYQQQLAQASNIEVPILAVIKPMKSLGMLGYNLAAVRELGDSYNGKIPELNDLSESDLEKLEFFETGVTSNGETLPIQVGIAYLSEATPGARMALAGEAAGLTPMVCTLAGDFETAAAWTALLQRKEAHV